MTPEYRIRLSKEQEELLKSLDKDIERVKEEIQRAKQLGVDVSQAEEYLKRAIELRDRLLKEYGGG